MTRDQEKRRDNFMRLARMANVVPVDHFYVSDVFLEKFAEMVAAEEREACAKVAEITYDKQIVWYPKGHYIDPNSLGDINKAVAEGCAAAIRARSEA